MSVLVCSVIDLKGQATRTPFSAFGVGDLTGTSLAHNQGMAGVGVSNPQYWYLNNQNPALLVFNTLTVFEGGLLGEQRTIKNSTTSEKNSNGNMNYLALGFPVKSSKWAMSFALSPYSTSNFDIAYTTPITGDPTATATVTESGSGGINQFSWSNGVAITKYFSVGVKGSYLFSSINHDFTTQLTETSQVVPFLTNIHERQNYSGLAFTGGLSLHKDSLLHSDYRFNLGVNYDFGATLNTNFLQTIERRTQAATVGADTLTIDNGSTVLPPLMTVGLSFGKGLKWAFGVDYTYSDYTQFKDLFGQNTATQKSQQMAAGIEYSPDISSIGSYLKRMTYRTGVSYSEAPYLINGKALKDFGINFGLSFPVNRSSLDIALRMGKRGDLQNNTVEEKYFKLYFGVTFNDRWFIKRKFD